VRILDESFEFRPEAQDWRTRSYSISTSQALLIPAEGADQDSLPDGQRQTQPFDALPNQPTQAVIY